MIGELTEFVPPALAGTALVALGASADVLVAGLVVAGVLEGLALGRAQGAVLRRLLPDVTGWTEATAIAVGLA